MNDRIKSIAVLGLTFAFGALALNAYATPPWDSGTLVEIGDPTATVSWETVTEVKQTGLTAPPTLPLPSPMPESERYAWSRSPNYSGGVLTGFTMGCTVTVSGPVRLNTFRLCYVNGGSTTVADVASELNLRISTSDVSATVSGTVPLTATRVYIERVNDGSTTFTPSCWGTGCP